MTTPTESQIVAAARALNKRHAMLCNVNEADSWNIQGEDFKDDAREALAAALAQPQPSAPSVEPARVYLVATGETHDGQETYTRHEGAPPPLCDGELLFSAPTAPAPQPAFDMLAHLKRQAEFSAKTFGPGARVEGVTDHIAKELAEVRESGGDLAEWVDVIILAFDGAWRSGASPAQIIDAMVAKQTKNEGRKWPDWRTAPAGKAIEHDRSGEVGAAPLMANGLTTSETAATASVGGLGDHVPAGPEAEAATDAKLGLVLLPPIRVDRATHAALQEAAKARGVIVQAIVRERLAPYAAPQAAPVSASATCSECGKRDSDGWALYCVSCIGSKIEPAAVAAERAACLAIVEKYGMGKDIIASEIRARASKPAVAAPEPNSAAPLPAREPTDDVLESLARSHGSGGWQTLADMVRFGRAVLRVAGITAAPAAQSSTKESGHE